MTAQYTFFSRSHETFFRIDHTLDHKGLCKFKRTEIIQSVLFDHKEIKLEINNRKIFGKPSNILRLDNALLLNNPWVKKEITGVIIKYF